MENLKDLTPAEQCAICGPSKHELRLKIDELASAACSLREALQRTRDILANRTNCGQFARPVDHAGCARCDMFAALNAASSVACRHQAEVLQLRTRLEAVQEALAPHATPNESEGDVALRIVAEVERLKSVIHEWEESDRARVLLGPTLDEAVVDVDKLRALCGEAGIWILSHQTFLDSHGENGQSQALIRLGVKLRAAAEGRKV